jgi:hypothetical protein
MKFRVANIAVFAGLACLLAALWIVRADDGGDEFEFTGTVQSLPGTTGFIGDWKVSGKTVHVTSATKIEQEDGTVAVGAVVEVQGTLRSDGSVDATEIQVKEAEAAEVEFKGIIQHLPGTTGFIGDWVVGGRTVHVTAATRIDTEEGAVAVGATVQVQGTQRADGSIDAQEIEVQEAEQAEVEFKGTITSLPPTGFIGDWMVGGKIIHVSAATRIDQEEGPVVVGALIQVEGVQRPDGSIDAAKIEVLSNPGGDDGRSELEGVIQMLPGTTGFIGDWIVSGRTVHVTTATTIDQEHGAVAVGAQVEVKGNLRSDGSLDAVKIEVKAGQQDDHADARFKGSIQSLPNTSDMTGDWVISTTMVHVTRATRLSAQHGAFVVGGRVKVTGTQRTDGSIDASRIKSLE